MNASSHPDHTSAPLEVRGLLIPLADLDSSGELVYVISYRVNAWQLVQVLDDYVHPSALMRPHRTDPRLLEVELGADLTNAPEGATTTVWLAVAS